MNWRNHITSDPDVLTGKPVIKGMRLSVDRILGLLENGWSETNILKSYPNLNPENVHVCVGYAREAVAEKNCARRPSHNGAHACHRPLENRSG